MIKVCAVCDYDLHVHPATDDRPYVGPVLRVTMGVLEHRKWGTQLCSQPFEDDVMIKWMHGPCAKEAGVIVVHLKQEHCVLCGHQFILHGDGYPGDSVIRFDRGHVSMESWELEKNENSFKSKHVGYVHYACAMHHTWRLPLGDSLVA